jgi:hypothetical protein
VTSLQRLTKDELVAWHLAKNHGEVFWLERDSCAETWATRMMEEAKAVPLVEGRFHTAPGMFFTRQDRCRLGLAGRTFADRY